MYIRGQIDNEPSREAMHEARHSIYGWTHGVGITSITLDFQGNGETVGQTTERSILESDYNHSRAMRDTTIRDMIGYIGFALVGAGFDPSELSEQDTLLRLRYE